MSEQSGTLAEDPFGGRPPTRHERMTGRPFHALDGDERRDYVTGLAAVTERDGTLYVLCFRDGGPDAGPHPVGETELRAAFAPGTGWRIVALEHDRVQTRFHDEHGAPAWLAAVERR